MDSEVGSWPIRQAEERRPGDQGINDIRGQGLQLVQPLREDENATWRQQEDLPFAAVKIPCLWWEKKHEVAAGSHSD